MISINGIPYAADGTVVELIHSLRAQLAAEQSGTAALRRELDHLRRDKQALRALVKEAFCEGAEGAPRPLNSDMESAWKHSESRELLESFLAWLDAHICWAVRRPAGESKP